MNKQRGYINLDLTGFIVGLVVVSAIAGAAVWSLAEWAWPYIKVAIHAMTA